MGLSSCRKQHQILIFIRLINRLEEYIYNELSNADKKT